MASTFRFVWDGNVLLHETFKKDNAENTELTTWVFEGFVPTAKLVNGKAYSIISDHLGTPILAIDSEGNEVWNRQLDIYGRVKREIKASSLGDDVRPFIPFLYQGQYYDFETNLAYNRFRYYSPETGAYISQDPIGLAGGNPNLYAYVGDSNSWVDFTGLSCTKELKKNMRKANKLLKKLYGFMKRAWYKIKGSAAHHIVPGDHQNEDADRARQVLVRNNIDINDADNGIYLRHMDKNSLQPGAYHREIHTNEYFRNIADRLEEAEADGLNDKMLSELCVRDELEAIRNDLLFNNVIW